MNMNMIHPMSYPTGWPSTMPSTFNHMPWSMPMNPSMMNMMPSPYWPSNNMPSNMSNNSPMWHDMAAWYFRNWCAAGKSFNNMMPSSWNNMSWNNMPSSMPSTSWTGKSEVEMCNVPVRPTCWSEYFSMANPIKIDSCGNRVFFVALDMHVYKPEEIKVGIKGGKWIVVEATFEEKTDVTKATTETASATLYPTLLSASKGCVRRSFYRELALPEDCTKPESVKCFWTPEGCLCIECPLPGLPTPMTMPSMPMPYGMSASYPFTTLPTTAFGMTPSKMAAGACEPHYPTTADLKPLWARGFSVDSVPINVTVKN